MIIDFIRILVMRAKKPSDFAIKEIAADPQNVVVLCSLTGR